MKQNERIRAEITTLKDERTRLETEVMKKIALIDKKIETIQSECSHSSKDFVNAYSRVWTCHNKFRCVVCDHVKYV